MHPGDETQLPDPLIEAHVGEGQAPAHRGLAYLVVEDLPLADFGNRIPNITAELTFKSTGAQPWLLADLISQAEGGFFPSSQTSGLADDWRRGAAYVLRSDSDAALAGIRRIDLRTMLEDRQRRMTDVTDTLPRHFPGTLFCGPDGHLYFNVGSGNSRPIVRVEPDALKEVGRFGEATSWLSNTTTSSVLLGWLGMVSAYGSDGPVDFLLTGSTFNDVGLLRADDMSYVWGAGERLDEARVRGIVGGLVAEGIGEGWLLGSGTATSHTSLALYRIRVTATAGLDPLTGATIGVELEKVASFAPSEIEAGAAGFYQAAGGLGYDATDDSVIFQVTMSEGGVAGTVYTLKWRSGDGMVWKHRRSLADRL